MKVIRKAGFVSAMLMMLVAMMVITPTTSAFFWSNTPTGWGYGNDPAQVPAEPDGTGIAIVNTYGAADCYSVLYGGTVGSPDEIDYTDDDTGYSLMFCAAYTIEARMDPYNRDTFCTASLELAADFGSGYGDPDITTADVQTLFPAIQTNTESGWLYVWLDIDYTDEPTLRLTLHTYTKYWDGYGWANFGDSPQSVSVYFYIDDETT